jgi:RHS repeat-associated protein
MKANTMATQFGSCTKVKMPPDQFAFYSNTNCIHSFYSKLLAEYDATGTCQKDYIYMGGKLITEYQPVIAKYYYYASDQINSTRIITDSAGAVVYSAVFDPYGGMQKQWVNTYQPSLKFSGKERESGSELDYFGARYYDHLRYRFISVDPIINKEEALANPQLWNLYAYCGNNPITRMDPDGRYAIGTSDRMIFNIAMMSVTPTGGPIFSSLNNDSRLWVFRDGTNSGGVGGHINPEVDISRSNGYVTGGAVTIDFNNIANYGISNASSLRTTGHEAFHLQGYSQSSQESGIKFVQTVGLVSRQDVGGSNRSFDGPAGLVGQSIQREFAGMMQRNPIGTAMQVSARVNQIQQQIFRLFQLH